MTINVLDTNGRWMVDNSEIYIPACDIQIQHTNVASADSGRTEDGVMHIDWVRRDVRKVNLQWKVMTGQELSYVMNLLQGKEFTFKYYDMGAVQTISAYCGESSYTKYSDAIAAESGGLYTDVSINVIEM